MYDSNERTPLTSSSNTSASDSKSSLWSWCARISTGGAIVVLACVNVFLFVQLQAVTYQVASNNSEIHQLQNQVTQQESETNIVNEKIEKEHSLTIFHMAGTFVLLTCLITMFHMTAHLRKFNLPDVQRKIVAILWMPPIYGVSSFVSLCIPSTHEYMMILKDFYEAYCIYQFLSFLIAVLGRGSRDAVIEVLAKHADHLNKPYRCLHCFFHPPPNASDHAMSNAVLLESQLLAMQFVFIKPVTAIITFLLHLMNSYRDTDDDGDDRDSNDSPWMYLLTPSFWLLMIQNVSVFFAFSGLLKFYHAVRDDLQWCQPFSKFLCIKGVVFMTFWQGLAIALVINLNPKAQRWQSDGDDNGAKDMAAMLQNILICVEMLFFSLAHFCVFPTDEWEAGYRPKDMEAPGMAFKDFFKEVGVVLDHTSQGIHASQVSATKRKTSPDEEAST